MLRKSISAVAILLGIVAGVLAYEMRISRLNSWELTFTSKPPRAVEFVENGALVNYRYVVYEVKNNTSQDVDFFPTFVMETEDGVTYAAQIFPAVVKRVQEHYGKQVLDTTKITGVLKVGESKKGVAVFRGVNGASDTLTVYVGGLSGDLKSEKTPEGEIVVLYRTYKLVYGRPGDEFVLALDPVNLKSAEWVWRR